MTWTLRLYDGNGIEIGYAKKADRTTYDYEITHPNGGWENFESQLRSFRYVTPLDENRPSLEGVSTSEFTVVSVGPMATQYEPEKHLRIVRDQFYDPDDVAEMTLENE